MDASSESDLFSSTQGPEHVFGPSSVLAPSSDALVTTSDALVTSSFLLLRSSDSLFLVRPGAPFVASDRS